MRKTLEKIYSMRNTDVWVETRQNQKLARKDETDTIKKFVEYGINSDVGIQQLNDLTKGATRPRVNLNHIRGLKIPSPNKLEQQRIVL